jgi:SAM-dependent methyltransferase
VTSPPERPDVDALVAELRARVERRRAEGVYPPGLEAELDAHFARVTSRSERPSFDRVRSALHELHLAGRFGADRLTFDSQLPGGSTVHRVAAKAVSRTAQGIFDQLREYALALERVLAVAIETMEALPRHDHPEIEGELDVVHEQLAALGTAPDEAGGAVAELGRRLEVLERAEAGRRFEPWFGADRFVDAFRGSRDDLLAAYAPLADRVAGSGPVLDVGCGRGEFVQLLVERGTEARGVDLDADAVAVARAAGLPVEEGDGLAALAEVPDGSLGAVVLLQVVEHLSAQDLVNLVALCADKVRPGGLVVAETVNPQSLYVYAHALFVDPTHLRPVHPAYLTFLFTEAGFDGVQIEWRSPPPDDDRLVDLPGDGEPVTTANANVARLNALLFAPQDYALLAVR